MSWDVHFFMPLDIRGPGSGASGLQGLYQWTLVLRRQPWAELYHWLHGSSAYRWQIIQSILYSHEPISIIHLFMGIDIDIDIYKLPWWLSGKESACQCSRLALISGLGRSPQERNDNPLQYSCLKITWTEEPSALQSTGP